MKNFKGPLPKGAKCTRCRAQATVRLPSHHANFCDACFLFFFRRSVRRAMKRFPIRASEPLLVAVSGGKDSLAVWSVLQDLGWKTKGIHLDLGIEEFSEASVSAIESFASARNLPWVRYSLKDVFGYTIPEIRKRTRRKICSVCGTVKRQLLNRFAVQEGFRVIVTGHNLDDEAGRLLGNLVRNRKEYIEKHYPYLPSTHPKLPMKIKPLYRVSADEIRTYCRLLEIDYLADACPLSRGATSHIFKEALEFLERKMHGTKRDFLFSYVEKKEPPATEGDFGTCRQCGQPCYGDRCSVCSLQNQLKEQEEAARSRAGS